VRNWAAAERSETYGVTPPEPDEPHDDIVDRELGTWEQRSVDLRVSDLYRQRFERFESSFAAEVDALGDDAMDQEVDVLETLSEFRDPPTTVEQTDDGETATASSG
jgi:hypothetical protein